MNPACFIAISISGFILTMSSSCQIPGRDNREKMVDRIMQQYDSENQPGASVLVMKRGKIEFNKGYGIGDISTGQKITGKTNFRLASLTKQFTAMAVLLLEQRGHLGLQDPLIKYFPGFPSYGKDITLQHLLTHSSGLMDYEDLMPDSQSVQLHDMDCLQLMYATDKLFFPAGTDYRYSNTGYAILSLVVEKVSGQPFAQFLKENIFTPLKMYTTVAHEEGKSVVKNRAMGHSKEQGQWKLTDQSMTSAVLGDGGIYSNGEELSEWVKALLDARLIGAEKQSKAFSRTTLQNGKTIDYGWGWHVEDFSGSPHPYHDGSSIGFRNNILLFPEEELMVLVLTNRDEGDPKKEATAIARLYLD